VVSVQVTVTSKHGTVKSETQAYIKDKAEKLLTYFDRVMAIGVTCTFEANLATVEIVVDAEHKHNFVAESSADSVTVAFDAALHKMETQIHKYKEKVQDHRRSLPMNEPGSEDES
jgi:putative sigma-54 modulation protein